MEGMKQREEEEEERRAPSEKGGEGGLGRQIEGTPKGDCGNREKNEGTTKEKRKKKEEKGEEEKEGGRITGSNQLKEES